MNRKSFILEHCGSAQLTDLYEVEATPLGVGGFGTVRLARLRGAENVVRAVKAVKTPSAAAERSVRLEVTVLKTLDHPHICRLLETFQASGCVYMVMEYIDGMELFDYIHDAFSRSHRPDESLAARTMRQLCGALGYCHGHGVVHRDVKPENVMMQRVRPDRPDDQVTVKLIDFGLAVFCQPGGKGNRGAAGTLVYCAPEARTGVAVSPASDMWSAGMVLHTLLVGGLPAEEVRNGEETLDTRTEEYAFVSATAKECLTGLLRVQPERRLSALEAASCTWATITTHAPVPQERVKDVMKSFSTFHRGSVLQRAMLTALAVHLASSRMSELQDQFLSVDRDRNGRISREELANFVRASGTETSSDVDHWVESVFESLDTDGSEELEYTEWLAAALRESNARTEASLRAAFHVCDIDRSGKISQTEVARIIAQTPGSAIAGAMREFDTDGDGELNFEEFCTLIRRSLGTPEVAAPPPPVRTKTLGKPEVAPVMHRREVPVATAHIMTPGSSRDTEPLAPTKSWTSVFW